MLEISGYWKIPQGSALDGGAYLKRFDNHSEFVLWMQSILNRGGFIVVSQIREMS